MEIPILINARKNVNLTCVTNLVLTFKNISILPINIKDAIRIIAYNTQLAINTEQKYFFDSSKFPRLYSTEIYLQAIELIDTATKPAYETKLFAKSRKPYASSPSFPIT